MKMNHFFLSLFLLFLSLLSISYLDFNLVAISKSISSSISPSERSSSSLSNSLTLLFFCTFFILRSKTIIFLYLYQWDLDWPDFHCWPVYRLPCCSGSGWNNGRFWPLGRLVSFSRRIGLALPPECRRWPLRFVDRLTKGIIYFYVGNYFEKFEFFNYVLYTCFLVYQYSLDSFEF